MLTATFTALVLALGAAPGPISWTENDYAAALTAAKAADKPLVLDMWAPWCHSCRSMQNTVLAGESMRAVAPRFVWLSVNTDSSVSAGATAKYPQQAWPTFLVVDPFSETVQARLVGSTSTDGFKAFLDTGERAYFDARGKAGGLKPDDPRRLLRDADRAAMAGDHATAATTYERALSVPPGKWKGQASARVSWVSELLAADAASACVDVALKSPPKVSDGAPAADFMAAVSACAEKLPDTDARKKTVRTLAAQILGKVVHDPKAPLSPDDRADAMRMLREIELSLGDEKAARAITEEAVALMDKAAAAATPEYAATFNMHRVDAYCYLGRGEALLPSLEANVAALPKEYDPPYRLAQLYVKLKRPADARKAGELALARVQGSRTGRVLKLLLDVATSQNDTVAAADYGKRLTEFEKTQPPKR